MNNKIVYITGGAQGIGKSIVTHFCKEGATVYFCDINEEAGSKLSKELSSYSCRFIPADVSNVQSLEDALKQVLAEEGTIDILINNAGISLFGSVLDVSVDEFSHVLDTNLRSVFVASQLLAKHRAGNPNLNTYGRIINIASTRYLMSEPDSEAYAASKGGVVSLTHALAISLAPYHITVNCISPGWIETGDYAALSETDHAQHPSGRVGRPEDIAQMCLFLCDPQNDFINGQNFTVDGGITKKMIYE